MAAGDLLTTPGQIEWDGQLIGVSKGTSGLWLTSESELEGWTIEYTAADVEIVTGGAAGMARPLPMRPTIVGLAVESAANLTALLSSMDPLTVTTPEPLCWWDKALNEPIAMDAVPRRCAVSSERMHALAVHRVVHLQWFVPDPTMQLLEGGSGSS